jgi:hypothetical protein
MKRNIFLWTCLLLMIISAKAQNIRIPVIPDLANNPYENTMYDGVNVGSTTLPTTGLTFGPEVLRAGLAYCHPQSPNKGNASYKARLLLLLNAELGDKIFGKDFEAFPNSVYAYNLLRQVFPTQITAAQKSSWEANIRVLANEIIADRGAPWKNKDFRPVWFNAECRWALGVYYSGITLNDAAIKIYGEYFFDETFQLKMFQPDGGINYTGYQNEVFTYHSENIEAYAEYYLASGDERVKRLIERTVNYYPMNIIKGVAEYYTAVCYKHYWNKGAGEVGAYIVASLTGDKHNYRLGKNASKSPLAAYFYNASLSDPASIPENYTMYDNNIQGPRGRYGNWNFAGTARKVDDYPNQGQNGLGKANLAGAMYLDNTGTWPLNAALDIATVEVKVASGAETTVRRGKYNWYTTNETSNITKGKQIYGLASKYNPSTKNTNNSSDDTPAPWDVKQEWIFTPERLVGMVEINPNADGTQAYAVDGLLKLVSGRSNWGVKKDLVNKGSGVYQYGNLFIKIHQNTFGGALKQEYSKVYDDNDVSEKSTTLQLIDNKSSGQAEALRTYNKTDKYHYVLEVYPTGVSPLATVVASRGSTLQSFTINDGKRLIRAVHNYSDVDQAYSASITYAYSSAVITKSWTTQQSLGTVSGTATVSLTIPARQHILIINSNTADDLDNNNVKSASEIFQTSPVGNAISMKGNNAKFVSSENGLATGMNCNRAAVGSWERFTVVNADNGKVAFKGSNGNYVSSENGTRAMRCDRTVIGLYESFDWIPVNATAFQLRGNNGKYVSSENGVTAMTCTKTTAGSWETFNWDENGTAFITSIASIKEELPAKETLSMVNGVYPNPAMSGKTISVILPKGTTSINIIDGNGHSIKQLAVKNTQQKVDMMMDVPAGIYFMQFINAKKVTVTKIVVQ